MCSLDDIQNDIVDLTAKLDRYHTDSEKRHDQAVIERNHIDARVKVIEKNYLTKADIDAAIDRSVLGPLREINETLKAIQGDLAPWKRRQQMWSLTQMLSRDAGGILVWIGQISVGLLALYGLGSFIGWW